MDKKFRHNVTVHASCIVQKYNIANIKVMFDRKTILLSMDVLFGFGNQEKFVCLQLKQPAIAEQNWTKIISMDDMLDEIGDFGHRKI